MSYTWKKFTRLVAHPERERELVKFTFSSIFPESFCVIDLKVTESHYCGSFPILSQAYVLYSCRCCALAKGTPPPGAPPIPKMTLLQSSPLPLCLMTAGTQGTSGLHLIRRPCTALRSQRQYEDRAFLRFFLSELRY